MNDISKYAQHDIFRVLVGTKGDLTSERQVSTDEGWQLAHRYNVRFFETSSKEDFGVREAFDSLVFQILSQDKVADAKDLDKIHMANILKAEGINQN